MANEVSKIKLNGTTYEIKDSVARQAAAGGVIYAGITTTALTDGASTSTITIGGESVTAENGMLAIYSGKEFIYSSSDSKWHEFGDMSTLGDLAYYDKASYTKPTGTGSATFEGTAFTATVKGTPTGAVNVNPATGTGTTYTPAGTVACPVTTVTPTTETTGNYVATSATGGGSVTAGTAASFTVDPSLTATLGTGAEAETLTITFDKGTFDGGTPTDVTLPSFTAKSIVTDVAVDATGTQSVNLAGTSVKLAFTGEELTSTGSNTATGNITGFTVGTTSDYVTPENNT